MPEMNPPTEYRDNIVKTRRTNVLRNGIATPYEAEESREKMDLKVPETPIVVRPLGKVVPIW